MCSHNEVRKERKVFKIIQSKADVATSFFLQRLKRVSDLLADPAKKQSN
jgi:hypothetical protein